MTTKNVVLHILLKSTAMELAAIFLSREHQTSTPHLIKKSTPIINSKNIYIQPFKEANNSSNLIDTRDNEKNSKSKRSNLEAENIVSIYAPVEDNMDKDKGNPLLCKRQSKLQTSPNVPSRAKSPPYLDSFVNGPPSFIYKSIVFVLQ